MRPFRSPWGWGPNQVYTFDYYGVYTCVALPDNEWINFRTLCPVRRVRHTLPTYSVLLWSKIIQNPHPSPASTSPGTVTTERVTTVSSLVDSEESSGGSTPCLPRLPPVSEFPTLVSLVFTSVEKECRPSTFSKKVPDLPQPSF